MRLFLIYLLAALLICQLSTSTARVVPPPPPSSLPASNEHLLKTCHDLHSKAVEYHSAGDSSAALSMLSQALQLLPSDTHLLNTYGVVLRASGGAAEAIKYFESAISSDPSNAGAHLNLAATYHYWLLPMIPTYSSDAQRYLQSSLHHYVVAYETTQSLLASGARPSSPIDLVVLLNDYAFACQRVPDYDSAIAALRIAVSLSPTHIQSLGNLVVNLKDLGQLSEALQYSQQALLLEPSNVQLLHNHGLILQSSGDYAGAKVAWEKAVKIDPDLSPSLASLGHECGHAGDLHCARSYYARAHAASLRKGDVDEAKSLELQVATAVVPTIYNSVEHVLEVRQAYEANLRAFLNTMSAEGRGNETSKTISSPPEIRDPVTAVGSSSLGYYIIYQGFDDVSLRRLFAQAFWSASPVLQFHSPHLATGVEVPRGPLPSRNGKIHVGFHSAFFYHHSVGLLMERVVRFVDRSRFHVTVFLQGASGLPENGAGDAITKRICESADVVVRLTQDVMLSRQMISEHNLDVLVFGEIGMDSYTYFLPFGRLARRTALFWGHAVTSGISTSDGVLETGLPPNEVGGIDYFVTSRLFERGTEEEARARYSERLYFMDGLTTSFMWPMKPKLGLTLASVGVPENMNVYLCPQTLYKLHPRFDDLLIRVLEGDEKAIVVFPKAARQEWTDQLMERVDKRLKERGGNEDKDLMKRVVLVRYLDFDEFIALAALANVVLDPFPVGGGRSSLEIFSVGTPIVTSYSRTNILQLTYGMYATMGILECVTYNDDDYISKALEIGKDRNVEARIRKTILANNHKIYESDKVVEEWNEFLQFAVDSNRPIANEHVQKQFPDVYKIPRYEFLEYGSLLPADPTILYSLKLNHEQPETGELQSIMIRLTNDVNPIEVAELVAKKITAEYVKYRWVAAVLQHGFRRHSERLIWQFDLVPGWTPRKSATAADVTATVRVHEGDDMALVATFYGTTFGLNDDGIRWLQAVLEGHVPEHDSEKWIAVRTKQDILSPSVSPKVVAPPIDNGACYLTIAFTTCKRLDLFKQTADSLLKALGPDQTAIDRHLCEILVVDDASSNADRADMKARYPSFRFIFKPVESKGHAKSMNLIAGLVRTKYMLYMEDDWLVIGGPGSALEAIVDATNVIRDAAARNYPLAQVLLNDQCSRACAYADPIDECLQDPTLGRAGWPRRTSSKHGNVDFVEHEFGVLYRNQGFSYWPGFSLNPGVWDLELVKQVRGGRDPLFDESNDRFEQAFSMDATDANLKFAHMAAKMTVKHIGVDMSSYVLNDQRRPFDKKGEL